MKVIVAIDDAHYSALVLNKICKRHWPQNVEFKILHVLDTPLAGEYGNGEWVELTALAQNARRQFAQKLASDARLKLMDSIPGAIVHFEIREGNPNAEIVDAAAQWEADKIIVGAHGRDWCPHFFLGSVSKSVANHAPCSVEIIRPEFKVA